MPEIIIVAHNIRSTYNVGAIFRTAEGFGVNKIICSGYTPYPRTREDQRIPHLADKITKQIHKTALGAEELVPFEQTDVLDLMKFKEQGYRIVGLELDERSQPINTYEAPEKIALLLGEEVDGISQEFRDACDDIVEIPMRGSKESYNVSVAAGIAMYELTVPFTSEPRNLRQVA